MERRDPILKERLFGLTNSEGNHGEDVKEYYFYLDSTPTHSYMKYLYKYPQAAYPYERSRRNQRAGGPATRWNTSCSIPAYSTRAAISTSSWSTPKGTPEDILIQITRVQSRARDAPNCTCCRRCGSATTVVLAAGRPEAAAAADRRTGGHAAQSAADAPHSGDYYLYCEGDACRCSSRRTRPTTSASSGSPTPAPYVKDGINDYVVRGRQDAVNPDQAGTKAAAHYRLGSVPARQRRFDCGCSRSHPGGRTDDPFGTASTQIMSARRREADEFYGAVDPPDAHRRTQAEVMRQAMAGMLWSKQYYFFDGDRWLEEHHARPPPVAAAGAVRNREWFHMVNDDIISMPDKWEYPWYAAWDLAFHTLPLAMVDPDFAKQQLD